jgi:hypothetical protein
MDGVMSEFPQHPQKPLQYDCASCGESLASGHGRRIHQVRTCAACGTRCALDPGVARDGARMAVKVVPTGSAAIMRPI